VATYSLVVVEDSLLWEIPVTDRIPHGDMGASIPDPSLEFKVD